MTSTAPPTSTISIIIPTLNEAATIGASLNRLRHERLTEVLVVDGGSQDGTPELAQRLGARVLNAPRPGRAGQMNLGASLAQGDLLCFLHADTLLPPDFPGQIEAVLAQPTTVAGAFRLGIDLPGRGIRLVERLANLRAAWLGLPYGDQALFLRRQTFLAVGGFPEEPILEDVLLVQRLKRQGRIGLSQASVLTSGRRWHELGLVKTSLINQAIMLGYLAGLPPRRLQGWYRIAQKIR